jgi:hypothetical protein
MPNRALRPLGAQLLTGVKQWGKPIPILPINSTSASVTQNLMKASPVFGDVIALSQEMFLPSV